MGPGRPTRTLYTGLLYRPPLRSGCTQGKRPDTGDGRRRELSRPARGASLPRGVSASLQVGKPTVPKGARSPQAERPAVPPSLRSPLPFLPPPLLARSFPLSASPRRSLSFRRTPCLLHPAPSCPHRWAGPCGGLPPLALPSAPMPPPPTADTQLVAAIAPSGRCGPAPTPATAVGRASLLPLQEIFNSTRADSERAAPGQAGQLYAKSVAQRVPGGALGRLGPKGASRPSQLQGRRTCCLEHPV